MSVVSSQVHSENTSIQSNNNKTNNKGQKIEAVLWYQKLPIGKKVEWHGVNMHKLVQGNSKLIPSLQVFMTQQFLIRIAMQKGKNIF